MTQEIIRLLNSHHRKVPILILGNKIDRSGAMTAEELAVQLELDNDMMLRLTGNTSHQVFPIKLVMCSILYRQGHTAGKELIDTVS